ncbi:Crp/Fnr family transcriptional regulator [Gemmobacter fulvus]|uniref:Crp/Fnr family transcriptional regulator n=1 Tax=Gemmobacter fulvus TaxID=2840474 RepID=A0A975P6J1_9RHOB|nr:Crp/Fnr family transcriptional regulator [Gemmobacter fulvus]MBT9245877.1 Crp/Fnr family transcriptional regulator [Gemmobacter fulvus]MDQ1846909.1 Crp/Fnr family transcriptional regulator [Gemmobacter fulvus]QWK89291.1 Crp/Fnr family transcriptional regulator [Gemmobacter fulvus]
MKNSLAFPHLLDASLLADLSDDQKITFLDACALRRFASPTEILSQGEPCPGLYLVAQGQVEVSYVDAQGNLSVVHISTPGDVLGDVEALSENLCAANCTAQANTSVLFCATPLIYTHLQSPVFVRNLAGIYYDRLMRDNVAKSVSQFYSVDQRLCIYLSQLTSEHRPQIRASQSSLAAIIGCSRQTVNRKLGELRDEAVIQIGKGMITVLDRKALDERIENAVLDV